QPATRFLAAIVFLVMLPLHDHPFVHMDNFHEGEHLTPAYLYLNGERPFTDVFVLHGLAVDGGLDALAGGRPSATRRLETVLDAATLALLVPIAAEVTATTFGLIAAVIVSLCGAAAFWVPVFPYFRLAPVLLATLGLLRFARSGRTAPLVLAFASASLGILWSLDTGTYALMGTAICAVLLRRERRVFLIGIASLVLPVLVLVLVRANVTKFLLDSYVIIPRAIDAVWSLTAPPPFTAAGARYYLPPVFYGFLLVLAWKRRDPRILIVAIFSLLLFRTASGRVSWSHTRFATPMLGLAFIGFVVEPLRNRIAIALLAIAAIVYFEVPQNLAAGAKLIAQWPSRQKHAGLVAHPLARGIYTTDENATTLATLKNYIDSLGAGTILDFSNERALYFMLRRKPPVRCFDIPMLSAPPLLAEAMRDLDAHPPIAVILGGDPALAVFDGVPNRDRVPELARWIDAHYPKRTDIGRFTVATR
ncbi:MAG TPA: hypothetical protein VJZ00_09730, partial [Thermoanaerobaculia bacterium]|nr:hypothetical protein [Thermoanaerobaculia bacterium]